MKSLRFEIDAGHAERLGDCLIAAGALSVASEDALAGTPAELPWFDEPGEGRGWQRVRMEVLFADGADEKALLRLACAAAGVAPALEISAQPVPDQDWVRATRLQFTPLRAGERIWVVPSWCAPPDARAINIVLDPGLAFGTGSHATTRLCLRWLERNVRRGDVVLDYGCGSGILAIAAMKLGAAKATGVDIDPPALAAAAQNAARNRVACEFIDAAAPIAPMADIVIANILANPLQVLAPLLAARTRPGGCIALSGILEPQAEEVVRAYARWFGFEPPEAEEGWVLLAGRRSDTAC
ncbi:MAG: 50S ribosomal protein L11 methyltransferase [Betaproteobacteria bacterium]|nr:50S ribosomal protein L11 methyltransferase [Betaproteobacteria bacterium]MBI2961201.1 50S ribosomal protein L11 methyltransferase [Betaproteobacteria bacterium]